MNRCRRRSVRLPDAIVRGALVLPGAFLGGCERHRADWSEDDLRLIYAAALAAIHEGLDRSEELVVDPRPRLLVEEGDGVVRMGDFNRYGDPLFSALIEELPWVGACRLAADAGCTSDGSPRFATVSEILPTGGREGVVLASFGSGAQDFVSARQWIVQLRVRGGEWRVVRMTEGAEARVRSGW